MNANTVTPSPMSSLAGAANPALAELKDIVTPEAIGHWPWAIGYWLLLGVLIIACILLLLWLKKRARRLAPRRNAKHLLVQLDIHSATYASEVNSLLKRVAMSYLPRENIAQLDGDAWSSWLDSALPPAHKGKIGPLLASRHRSAPLNASQAQQLAELSKLWLSSSHDLNVPILGMGDNLQATQSHGQSRVQSTPSTKHAAEAKC